MYTKSLNHFSHRCYYHSLLPRCSSQTFRSSSSGQGEKWYFSKSLNNIPNIPISTELATQIQQFDHSMVPRLVAYSRYTPRVFTQNLWTITAAAAAAFSIRTALAAKQSTRSRQGENFFCMESFLFVFPVSKNVSSFNTPPRILLLVFQSGTVTKTLGLCVTVCRDVTLGRNLRVEIRLKQLCMMNDKDKICCVSTGSTSTPGWSRGKALSEQHQGSIPTGWHRHHPYVRIPLPWRLAYVYKSEPSQQYRKGPGDG